MHVVLPLPPSLVLLALALPGVWAAGAALAAASTRCRMARQALSPILAIAMWLLAVHVVGLAALGFAWGLVVGTLGVALAGAAASALRRRRPELAALGPGIGARGAAWIAASGLPVAWMAFRWAFHDEDLLTGHMSIASEILNGVYPPRHLTFAESPLRYHYGFDLLVASIAAVTRARVDVAIDLATIVLWLSMAALLFALGELFARRGPLALALVALAGGPPACLFGAKARSGLPGVCVMPGPGSLSPFVSSFFQHPWALGVPLALGALLLGVVRDRHGGRARAGLVAMGLLLVTLALGHVVLFVALVPTLVAAETWRAARRVLGGAPGARALAPVVAVSAIACGVVLATTALGLAPWSFGGAPRAGAGALELQLARGATFASIAQWNLQAFGALLPLGVIGLVAAPRTARRLLAPLVATGLVLVSAVTYVHSGDILKLGVVAQIALALAATCALGRARGPAQRPRIVRFVVAGAFVVASTSGGIAFVGLFLTGAADRWFARSVEPMAEDDQRAASFLRARIEAGEVVYRERRHAAGYAQWGGLPSVWDDWGTHAFPFPEERFVRRANLLKALPAAPASWLDEGVRWLVLGPLELTPSARADAWIAAGDATLEATFGDLRVVRLTGGTPARLARER